MTQDLFYSCYNIVNVSEVSSHISMIVNLDRFARHDLFCKFEIGHIRSAHRPVNRKKAKSRQRNSIQLAVSIRHKLIGFLGCCVQAYRLIHLIFCGKGHLLISTINRTGRCKYKMLYRIMAAGLQNMEKSFYIGADIGIRIFNAVSDSRLGCQINHHRRKMLLKNCKYRFLIRKIRPVKLKVFILL